MTTKFSLLGQLRGGGRREGGRREGRRKEGEREGGEKEGRGEGVERKKERKGS